MRPYCNEGRDKCRLTKSNLSHRFVCICDGCLIDSGRFFKTDKTLKWYSRVSSVVSQYMTNWNLTDHFSSIVLTTDVALDIITGLEHWNHDDVKWATATWSLMFVPTLVSIFLS